VTLSPSPALPSTLTGSSPVALNLLGMTLPEDGVYTVTVTVTDVAGNPETATFEAVVDLSPPAAVTIEDFGYDPRRLQLDPLVWTAVGDDGMGGGPVASYTVKYSTNPIDETSWDDACDFAEIYSAPAMPEPAPPGPIHGPDDFRRRHPDGRMGSDPFLARADHGRTLLELAAAALAADLQTFLAADDDPG
jgi:hypothetical protein